jgi:hypothetical protein
MVEGVNPPWNNSNKRLPERLKLKSPKLVRLACEADKAARKRHASPRDRCDGSGDSDEEAGDVATSRGHHPKFNRCCPTGREQLQDQS